MSLETWTALLPASAVLLAVPGPTILLVAGAAPGDVTATTLSHTGLEALTAASATAFAVLKWAGAAYLVWLGLRLWRAAGAQAPLAARRALRDAHLVTAPNPKGIAFFVAFVAQLVAADAAFLPQAAVLVATFMVLAAASAALHAALAGRLSDAATRPPVPRGLDRLGRAMLMGAGAATAAAVRRA